MSTTVVTEPNNLTPARDPAWLKVLCDGLASTPPTQHSARLFTLPPAQPSDEDEITITVPDGRQTTLIAVVGTPDDSGTQFQIGATTVETVENLRNTLAQNHLVSSLYTVTLPFVNAIDLVSRAAGAGQLAIDLGGVSWITLVNVVLGSDGDLKPNYRLGVALFVEEEWLSDVFVRSVEYSLTPDDQQYVSVDLAPLLLPHLNPVWPAIGGTSVVRSLDLQKRYTITRWERYGTPPRERMVMSSGTKTALYAGSRNIDHNRWAGLSTRIRTGGVLGQSPWLTYRGRSHARHEVCADQPHYLGWWCWVERVPGEALTLRAKVYYTDGTSTESDTTIAASSTALLTGEMSQWPAGFDTLGLGAWSAGRVAYKYELWIVNASATAVSERHMMWLVEPDPNEVLLDWVNSFGAIETMRCIGASTETLTPSYTTLTRALTPGNSIGPAPSEAAAEQRTAGVAVRMDVFSGFADALEHAALCDILSSPAVMLVDRARNTRIPVRLAAGTHELKRRGEDDETLYALALKLDVSDAEMAWSNIPTIVT